MVQETVEKGKDAACKDAANYELCHHFVNAFEIIGKKWNGLIISSLCDTKEMRFRDLAHSVRACSDRVLVERLKELEDEKIVHRSVNEKTGIISYSLTPKGAALKPVFDKVHDWADQWA